LRAVEPEPAVDEKVSGGILTNVEAMGSCIARKKQTDRKRNGSHATFLALTVASAICN
jgi:hypothetical protein